MIRAGLRLVEKDEGLQAHPAAEIFPLMVGAEFDALVADIKVNGQREPIIIHDGQILDGRNRYRACRQVGIEAETLDWNGRGTPEAFVVSMNLHRRHLNESQRAMIAAKMATRRREETLIPNAAGRGKLDVDIPSSSMTAAQAATLLNVSRDTVQSAKRVLREAAPEEIEAVHRGDAGVNTIVRKMRDGDGPRQRKANRDAPLGQRGNNPERIQRQQMQAEIWAKLSDALLALTSLPLASDVVEIVNANPNRRRVVDEKLGRSLNWLSEFQRTMARPNE